ncbi:TetR/AcrR family transcriptional regulator [Actinomadura darangshiensis]|uniref:TetR/AcrR family transcriptional regulator n=1 Tax=Actinomadura darangshiensis TaxID=705336 RepID=A0A4V2YT53_9ACTN|nr:TetR/AcrR family transcriptional regulator [Actinomadura darangshiensis]TDD72467.1 TetR/AcrR family transcriptional regulator [Actinomadura darangshiensis]
MRDRILDAVEQLLVSGGADAIRLDAVAAEAGVSKGGLLHHFRSKQALLAGVLERLVERFEAELPPAGSGRGAFTRAWLDATIPEDDIAAQAPADRVAVALLAGLSGGPGVLSAFQRHYETWQDRLAGDGLDPATAHLVRLAVDGWWMARLLNLAPPRGGLHAEVRARLASMIEEDA